MRRTIIENIIISKKYSISTIQLYSMSAMELLLGSGLRERESVCEREREREREIESLWERESERDIEKILYTILYIHRRRPILLY